MTQLVYVLKDTIDGCTSADSSKNWNIVYDIIMAMLSVHFFQKLRRKLTPIILKCCQNY